MKSGEELSLLRVGADVAKIGANAFLEAISENVTEITVAARAVLEMDRALGALFPDGATSAYAYSHFGDHTLTPHHHPTGRRLRRGDVVALNVFPVVWGYCMELERTFVFGTPTLEQERALSAVNEAFEAAKARVVPGASMADLDRLTRDLVEPGVSIPDLSGFRHSDVMLVTEEGASPSLGSYGLADWARRTSDRAATSRRTASSGRRSWCPSSGALQVWFSVL